VNERIRTLLARAEYQVGKQYGPDWEVYVEPSREQILEKFAELIVQECMRVVGNPTCPNYAYQAIQKHFGVEE
jgi:hypothetical protein